MGDTIGRTFIFEKSLWSKLDEDAKRCGRSSVKQLEAILKTYYQVEDVELNQQSLQILGEIMPRGKKTIRMLKETASVETGKRKAS